MNLPPNDALHPFHLDMPRPSGMTACAGTEMTQDFSPQDLILTLRIGTLRRMPSIVLRYRWFRLSPIDQDS
jgi:hypothetical protein